jgi:hypothetical protein
MSNDYTMSVKNKQVWDFYNEHPHLDFESLHVLFVQMLQNTIDKITINNSSVISQLLTYIKDNQPCIEHTNPNNGKSELFSILNKEYPSSDITIQSDNFIMKRKNSPVILFKNKEHDNIINKEEVSNFIREINDQNISGIFMSQHYGITNKENFEIELHNGNVLVYLHKVEYDADKIKAAVDIIDHFKSKMEDINNTGEESINIDKDILDEINKEYQMFTTSKLSHIKTIKDFNQRLLLQAEEFKIPSLEKYLSKLYASSSSKDDICEYCNYVAKNARALTAHYRGCSQKKQMASKTVENIVVGSV